MTGVGGGSHKCVKDLLGKDSHVVVLVVVVCVFSIDMEAFQSV